MQPSVLFVASTGSHIRNFHLPYLRWFRSQGWTVHVACGTPAGELPNVDRLLELPFEKSMTAPSNFRAAAALRRAIRQEQYALVCVHTSLAAFFTRLALLGETNRPPLVNVVHGYLYDDKTAPVKRAVLRAAERLTAPVTDLVLTMNDWDFREAKEHRLGRRVASIPGIGVDFSRLKPERNAARATLRKRYAIPEDAFVLIYAAEFSSRKNQSFLIRAMPWLPSNVFLVLAGKGMLLDDCKALAEEAGVAERVRFPGHIDINEWYPAADAAVSASRSEGLPFNIMEAMYMGLPVVASAVKGHTDLICEGDCGLIYPYGDTEEFSRQVTRLLKDPSLRLALSTRAEQSVRSYGLEFVLPQVIAEYESLMPDVVPV